MSTKINMPGFIPSLITFGAIIVVISYGLFVLKTNLQSLLLVSLIIAAYSAWRINRQGFLPIRQAMSSGVSRALGAVYIFILIGVVIASFIQSGTVATLIYYGLEVISPAAFLPAGLILCSLMSLATGTSWGTAGTAGIILIGMGSSMGIPLPVVAGMVVSGATFGDKMSPVSDTTNLAAMSAGVDLYQHIKSLMYTTMPTYVITLVLFTFIGFHYSENRLPLESVHQMMEGLSSAYHIGIVSLIPMIVMIVLSVSRVSPEPAMIFSSISAVLIAVFQQGESFSVVMNSLLLGHANDTHIPTLNKLLMSGGISSMMPTLSITLLTLTLGGILHKFGFLHVLMSTVLKRVKRAFSLVLTTLITCFLGNVTMGEAYMSILLGGQIFREAYEKNDVDGIVLSRSLEEGATLTTTLIPWATGGLFFAATLQVPVTSYAPWALLNWINPIVSLLFAFFGIAIWYNSKRKTSAKEYTNNNQIVTQEKITNSIAGQPTYPTSNSDTLSTIRNLPKHLLNHISELIMNRQGSTPEAFMVTEDIKGIISPGKSYQLQEGFLLETPAKPMSKMPQPEKPLHIRMTGFWSDKMVSECEENNIFGKNGRHFFSSTQQNMMIPTVQATAQSLAFYGCRLITKGESIFCEGDSDLPVTIINTGKDYHKHYLCNSAFVGESCLETHNQPHLYMPLTEEAGGYLLLGIRKDSNQLLLSAFKIPYGYAVYMAPWTIHSRAHLIGRYLTICSIENSFSTIALQKNNGEHATLELDDTLLNFSSI